MFSLVPPFLNYLLRLLLVAGLLNATNHAAASEDLGRRNYHVRIAIATGAHRVAIEGIGAYHVINPKGESVYVLKPGELHTVDIVKGRPGGKIYRLVIKELDHHLGESALTLARAAQKAYGVPAKAIRMPARTASETDRLLVTVGEFTTLDAAKQYVEELKNEKIQFIFEERARALEGQVIIRDYRGRMVASDPAILRLVPLDIEGGSIYFQTISDVKSWNPESIHKARHYRGRIELAIDEDGALTAVNDLWIEYYLYGVVAAEMGAFAPDEALRAQAVVSRSEAVAKIDRGIVSASPLYDFVDSAIAQAYKGKGMENERVRQAVDMTRGEILVHNGKPVDAVYSHSCGGVISSAFDQWDGHGQEYSIRKADRLRTTEVGKLSSDAQARLWTSGATDSFCNPNQPDFPNYAKGNFRWSRSFTADELTKMFDASYGTGRVKDITIERRSDSGRVRSMVVVGEKKTVKIDRELWIRSALDDIKSTFFTLDKEFGEGKMLKSLTVRGAGFGHGVGMCQMGAYMMALKKYTHRQILGHYFVNVKVRRLYG